MKSSKVDQAAMAPYSVDHPSFFIEGYTFDYGELLDRPNRFLATVRYQGRDVHCHVPDPGRLKEIMLPGRMVLLRFPKHQVARKTVADLIAVQIHETREWVSVDSQLGNRLIRNLWKSLPILSAYEVIFPEYQYENSRFDFFFDMHSGTNPTFVEVKTANLVREADITTGYFPDAPTKRGKRHILELISAVREGFRAIVLFVCPRGNVAEIKTNVEIDRDFSLAALEANSKRVEFFGLCCEFTVSGIRFVKMIPVRLA